MDHETAVMMDIIDPPHERHPRGLQDRYRSPIPYARASIQQNRPLDMADQFLLLRGDTASENGGVDKMWEMYDRIHALEARWHIPLTNRMTQKILPLLLTIAESDGTICYFDGTIDQFQGTLVLSYLDPPSRGYPFRFSDTLYPDETIVPFLIRVNPAGTVFTLVPLSDAFRAIHEDCRVRKIRVKRTPRYRGASTPDKHIFVYGRSPQFGEILIFPGSTAWQKLETICSKL